MLPHNIAAMIDALVSELDPFPNDLPWKVAKKHGAIPLMGDIGGAWLLRSDGTFWEVEWDSDEPPKALIPERRVMALAVGAERFPWLSLLLPPVPENAVVCKPCRGEGRIRLSADRSHFGILCGECHALGWKVG